MALGYRGKHRRVGGKHRAGKHRAKARESRFWSPRRATARQMATYQPGWAGTFKPMFDLKDWI